MVLERLLTSRARAMQYVCLLQGVPLSHQFLKIPNQNIANPILYVPIPAQYEIPIYRRRHIEWMSNFGIPDLKC